jgi:hypothetical protein
MKLNKYYLLGIAVNIIFCILPVYDTSNLYSWTQLGLAFTRSTPAFFNSIYPN